MFELPYPSINGNTAEEKIVELQNYLWQLKETLETIVSNISVDNLSDDLVETLNSLGSDIAKTSEETEEYIQQIQQNNLTISDVINSDAFQLALENYEPTINLTVNFETGNLEY